MADEVHFKQRLIRWGLMLLVALLGASAKQARDCQLGELVSVGGFLARIAIAAFAGTLVVLIGSEYGVSDKMVGAIAGIAGYTGTEAIEGVRRFVVGRYGR